MPRGGGSPTGTLTPMCEWRRTAATQCTDRAEYTASLPSGLRLSVCVLHRLAAVREGAEVVSR